MATLNFPSNPTIGDIYEYEPYRYTWDGEKWKTIGIGYNPAAKLSPTVRSNIQRLASEAGYNLVSGSFEDGGTLTVATDVLWHQADGKYYSWGGTLPKVVAAASTPATSGGVVSGAWVDRTDDTLRSDIAHLDGYALIGSMSYSQLRAYAGEKSKVYVWGISSVFDGASGIFDLDATDTTSVDNSTTIIVDIIGRRWKRRYSGLIQPEWAGAMRNSQSTDCTTAIQTCLAIGPTEISSNFYIAGTLTVMEDQHLEFTGGQLWQTTAATTSIKVYYGGTVNNAKINTSLIDMDNVTAFPVVEIQPWNTPAKMKKTKATGSIIGNFPNLQGIGVRLYGASSAVNTYSLIQFAEIDFDVYGLRDALQIDVTQNATTDIVYVNSSSIKIRSKNCYRPIRIINNAALAQITSGNCNVADNDIILNAQHYTGTEDMLYADGATGNRITLNPSDWSGYLCNLTSKSSRNSIDGSFGFASLSLVNDATGTNIVKNRTRIAASVVFNGVTGSMYYAHGGTVTKLETGGYRFLFNEPFSNTNSFVSIAQGSNSGITKLYPITICPTASKGAGFQDFVCFRSDTGANVDIDLISFSATGA